MYLSLSEYMYTSSLCLDVALRMITKARTDFPKCSSEEESKPMDCEAVLRSGRNTSGVYSVWPRSRVSGSGPLDVYCDMDTEGGGWTVVQRRGDFSRPKDFFFQDWEAYRAGFGDIEKDFWLGNDNLFALTNQRLNSIRFDLKAVDGEKRFALYDSFWIDDENNNYTIHIKGYSGDAGDSMNVKHDNQRFSTKDRDNDNLKDASCSQAYKGGWWYNACHDSNLNGRYLRGVHETHADGVNWKLFRGHKESLDTSEMKIRPQAFRRTKTSNKP
ncbi:techylectin-5A [Caerostris extrusa]|uniref:Techylectin-5A n=1 Tax=Caerostris extrusa TaxID=172846 RepID=A0AAV4MV22_CAEEX|nr:techylectin-5A [Caerostris extrusa]